MKTYYVDGKGYIDIEGDEEQRFISEYPAAIPTIKYQVPGKGAIDILPDEEKKLLETYRNAYRVGGEKRKDPLAEAVKQLDPIKSTPQGRAIAEQPIEVKPAQGGYSPTAESYSKDIARSMGYEAANKGFMAKVPFVASMRRTFGTDTGYFVNRILNKEEDMQGALAWRDGFSQRVDELTGADMLESIKSGDKSMVKKSFLQAVGTLPFSWSFLISRMNPYAGVFALGMNVIGSAGGKMRELDSRTDIDIDNKIKFANAVATGTLDVGTEYLGDWIMWGATKGFASKAAKQVLKKKIGAAISANVAKLLGVQIAKAYGTEIFEEEANTILSRVVDVATGVQPDFKGLGRDMVDTAISTVATTTWHNLLYLGAGGANTVRLNNARRQVNHLASRGKQIIEDRQKKGNLTEAETTKRYSVLQQEVTIAENISKAVDAAKDGNLDLAFSMLTEETNKLKNLNQNNIGTKNTRAMELYSNYMLDTMLDMADERKIAIEKSTQREQVMPEAVAQPDADVSALSGLMESLKSATIDTAPAIIEQIDTAVQAVMTDTTLGDAKARADIVAPIVKQVKAIEKELKKEQPPVEQPLTPPAEIGAETPSAGEQVVETTTDTKTESIAPQTQDMEATPAIKENLTVEKPVVAKKTTTEKPKRESKVAKPKEVKPVKEVQPKPQEVKNEKAQAIPERETKQEKPQAVADVVRDTDTATPATEKVKRQPKTAEQIDTEFMKEELKDLHKQIRDEKDERVKQKLQAKADKITSDIVKAEKGVKYKTIAETPEMQAVRKQHEGKDTWLTAPNGKPTNLNERQWLQVRTPSFKAWFGDWENDPKNASKVVDENGEPKPVWHGARAIDDFTVFDEKLKKYFFTDDINTAENFMKDTSYVLTIDGKTIPIQESEAQEIVSSIEMYEDVDWGLDWNLADVEKDIYPNFRKHLKTYYGVKASPKEVTITKSNGQLYEVFLDIKDPKTRNYQGRTWGQFDTYIEKDIDNSKDGFIAENIVEGGLLTDDEFNSSTTYVVFSPTQIKSATANIGTYDPNNADIRYKTILDSLKSKGKTIRSVANAVAKTLSRAGLVSNVKVGKDTAVITLKNGNTININLVDGTIESDKAGRIQYADNILAIIDIAKNYNEGNRTAYHEVGHLVFDLFLNETDQNILRDTYGSVETAMDKFGDYMAKQDTFSGRVGRIFAKLWSSIKSMFNDIDPAITRTAEDIFEQVRTGKYDMRLSEAENKALAQLGEARYKEAQKNERVAIANATSIFGRMREARTEKELKYAIVGHVKGILKNYFRVESSKTDAKQDANYRKVLNSVLGINSLNNITPQQMLDFLSKYDPLALRWLGDPLMQTFIIDNVKKGGDWNSLAFVYNRWKEITRNMPSDVNIGAVESLETSNQTLLRRYGKGFMNLLRGLQWGHDKEKELQAHIKQYHSAYYNATKFIDRNEGDIRTAIDIAIAQAVEKRDKDGGWSEEGITILKKMAKEQGLDRRSAELSKGKKQTIDITQDIIDAYKVIVEKLNIWRDNIKEHTSIKTLDNYYPQYVSKYVEDVYRDSENLKDIDTKNRVGIFSRSTLERDQDDSGYSPDRHINSVERTLGYYFNTMAKVIAYDKVRKYYYSKQFNLDATEPAIKKYGTEQIAKYIIAQIHPERLGNTPVTRTLIKMRNNYIPMKLIASWNFVVLNPVQRFMTRARVSTATWRSLTGLVHGWTGRLKTETPFLQAMLDRMNASSEERILKDVELLMREIDRNDKTSGFWKRASEKMDRGKGTLIANHPAFLAEIGNWNFGFLGGAIEYLHRTPEYTNAKKSGQSEQQALETALMNKENYERAYMAGTIVNAKVNPNPASLYTPFFLKHPWTKMLMLFARFGLNMTQQTAQVLLHGKDAYLPVLAENAYLFGNEGDIQTAQKIQTANLLLKEIKSDGFLKNFYSDKKGAEADKELQTVKEQLTAIRDGLYQGLAKDKRISRSHMARKTLEYVYANIMLMMLIKYLRNLQYNMMHDDDREFDFFAEFVRAHLNMFSGLAGFSMMTDIVEFFHGDLQIGKTIDNFWDTTGLPAVPNKLYQLVTGETITRSVEKALKE
jgi:hypothetical protein